MLALDYCNVGVLAVIFSWLLTIWRKVLHTTWGEKFDALPHRLTWGGARGGGATALTMVCQGGQIGVRPPPPMISENSLKKGYFRRRRRHRRKFWGNYNGYFYCSKNFQRWFGRFASSSVSFWGIIRRSSSIYMVRVTKWADPSPRVLRCLLRRGHHIHSISLVGPD